MAASAGWRRRRGTDERSRWRAVEREGQEWQGEVGVQGRCGCGGRERGEHMMP